MGIVDVATVVEAEPSKEEAGRPDVPVTSWIGSVEKGQVLVMVRLRSGQVLGWGYGTDYFLPERN